MFGGVIGKIFGTDEATGKVVDHIANGFDKLIYTDEEEADDAAQARREGRAVFMKWLESTTGSRIARRCIAVGVTGTFLLLMWFSILFALFSVFTNDAGTLTATKFIEASQMLAGYANDSKELVGVILLFYFGGPAAIDASKALIMKWTEKKVPQPK